MEFTTSDIARIDNIEILSHEIAKGMHSGYHLSQRSGYSDDFRDYRSYSGEDIKRIDWKLYARTDKLFLKKYDEHTTNDVFVLLDISASMDYGVPLTKTIYSRYIAAVLSIIAIRQRDRLSLSLFNDTSADIVKRNSSRHALDTVFAALRDTTAKNQTDLNTLTNVTRTIEHSVIFFITDLWFDENAFLDVCRGLRRKKNDVYIIQILDKTEAVLANDQTMRLLDSETNKSLVCSFHEIKGLYKKEFDIRQEYIGDYCRSNKIYHIQCFTDESLYAALRRTLR